MIFVVKVMPKIPKPIEHMTGKLSYSPSIFPIHGLLNATVGFSSLMLMTWSLNLSYLVHESPKNKSQLSWQTAVHVWTLKNPPTFLKPCISPPKLSYNLCLPITIYDSHKSQITLPNCTFKSFFNGKHLNGNLPSKDSSFL